MKTRRMRVIAVAGAATIMCLALILAPLSVKTLTETTNRPEVVPTMVCACASQVLTQSSAAPRLGGSGIADPSGLYDEQLGLTFTQSFTSMEYNVTAVEQTDQTLGDGPAYLLSGLTSEGYWYQVGVSWNWAPGQVPGSGFDMNYEVFNPAGNSIFPTNGQGGVLGFSGPVNEGDNVLLDLYFSSSSRSVVMLADDTNTGATASEQYSSMGASFFVGLPGSSASTNGFFTGLMTEWYHGVPYYANEAEVIYSNPTTALSSAWMWMDEFNANNFQAVFSSSTMTPVTFSDSSGLQEFSFNGTTEYSDAHEFVTGSLGNSTQQAPSTVPLTLSFAVLGGGTGYSPPTITYVSNGTSTTAPLTETPTVFMVEAGTTWSVSPLLTESAPNERFETNQTASGFANTSETLQFDYFTQFYVMFGFSVTGGGSGYSSPTVTYTSFGFQVTTPTGVWVWADAATRFDYQSLLPGSSANERWYGQASGTIGASQQIQAVYYNQYLVTFKLSFENTELFPAVTLASTSADQPYSVALVLGVNGEWLDSGSSYSVPQFFSLGTGQRLAANSSATGNVSADLTVVLLYEHQFYIAIVPNTVGGGTTSPSSGWYDSGLNLQMKATAAPGWRFEGWTGVGADSESNSSAAFPLQVGPGAPANETAVFYPGVAIDAAGPDSVTYQDGAISGSVPSGTNMEVYVPPSSTLSLKASNDAPLTAFKGWSGASSSSGAIASLVVEGPGSVTGNSEYNYFGIGVLSLAIVLAAALATIVVIRRRGTSERPLP